MSDTSKSLTSGPIWRALARMTSPMMLGILAVLSVGLADAYFLGQLGGAQLAAVGFIYPVTAAVTSLAIGLSAGANAAVSNAIGAEEGDATERRLALHAMVLGITLACIVAAALYGIHWLLFPALGASETVMTEVSAFIPWWCLSFPFLVSSMTINALFRAHGDSRVSAGFMVAESLINIALTPTFIFGLWLIPELGTAGAAIATLTARALMACCALAYAHHRGLVGLGKAPTKDIGQSVRTLGKVGGPAAFSNAINPAGMALVTAAVATLGDAFVAGFGAATRVQSLAMVPLLALSAGIGPVVGQNWGAGKHDRAAKALSLSFQLCVAYGLLAGIVLSVFATPITSLFATEEQAIEAGSLYLRLVGFSFFGYGMVVTANAAMNARDKALWSMSLSLSRIFLIYLPGAWLGVWLFGYPGIIAAAIAANVITAIGAAFAARHTCLLRTKGNALPRPLDQVFG